jgi:hypothetical protein
MRRKARRGQVSGIRAGRVSSDVCYGRRAVSSRRQYSVFFGLVVAVIAVVVALGRARGAARLLDTVPRDAWLVATLDVAALRASPVARPLLAAGESGPIPGLSSLTARCGFDPVARLRELVVTSPEGGERGDFGVAFTGDFTRDELARCADRVIRARGGSPATSARGGFTLVEDRSDAMHARLAYREGGPFLVGRGAWLDAMIDATEDEGPRLRSEHTDLRAALAGKSNAPRALVVTALLPASVRDQIRAELGPEVGGESGRAYAGVLAVSAAGLAVSLGSPSDPETTELAAEMRCESSSACDEVKKLLERERLALAGDLAVRLIGLGPLLESLAVDARGPSLRVSAHASNTDLARGIERIVDFAGRAAPPEEKSGRERGEKTP